MTAQEVHIELDLGLQRINSFDTSELLPQEKDWFINNEVLKFIKQRTNPKSNIKGQGFEDTIKRLEDIKDLITYKTLPVIDIDGTKGQIIFPPDYLDYISSSGLLYNTCDNLSKITNIKRKFTFSINNELANTSLPYSVKIEIEKEDGTILNAFDSDTLPASYIEVSNINKSKFLMINAIMIYLPEFLKDTTSNSSLYRQIYGNEFVNNSFILITNQDVKRIRVYVNDVYSDYGFEVNSFFSFTKEKSDNLDFKRGKIEIVNHQFIIDFNNSVLSKSTNQKVNSRINKNILEVFYPNGFVMGSIDLIYVCKPQKMDLILNRNLNFETDVCKEIIDNTVRYLKAVLSDSNYQAYIQENSLIE